MSGGSMDYLYSRVRNATFRGNSPERRAFRAHLEKVAEALYKIEWNDSGDGADGEAEAILACLGEAAMLESATAEAIAAAVVLRTELDRAMQDATDLARSVLAAAPKGG